MKNITNNSAAPLPNTEKSFRTDWQQAMRGETRPIADLWEDWDELFATPESEAFLTQMIAEVRQEEAAGTLIEGGSGMKSKTTRQSPFVLWCIVCRCTKTMFFKGKNGMTAKIEKPASVKLAGFSVWTLLVYIPIILAFSHYTLFVTQITQNE